MYSENMLLLVFILRKPQLELFKMAFSQEKHTLLFYVYSKLVYLIVHRFVVMHNY